MSESLSDFFNEQEFVDTNLAGDDLFSILESHDGLTEFPTAACSNESNIFSPKGSESECPRLSSRKSSSSYGLLDSDTELEASSPKRKKQKLMGATAATSSEEATPRMSHITVERNRRKQMNEHLSVLRSLMPGFYVKRGDQASIIGGVVDYITELQHVLQSLEAKKQRKIYSDVLSPRPSRRPTSSQLSPRKLPLSPRLNLPISPRTPQSGSPYRPRLQPAGYLSPTIASPLEPIPSPSSTSSSIDSINELAANSKSQIADVEVKFSGLNLLLKTVSPRIPGQALRIISALDELALEILHVNINTVDDTLLNSFTIKIGIECQLSAEELAQQIQRTFSHVILSALPPSISFLARDADYWIKN